LNGFAEGSLPAREQRDVLAHLAFCAGCRQALGLAAAAAPPDLAKADVISISRRREPVFRAWLPVAAAAAGIAITSPIAFRYAHISATRQNATAVRQAAPPIAPSSAQPGHPPASETTPSNGNPPSSTPAFASQGTAPGSSITTVNAARPQWRINDHGQLERSSGDSSWRVVLGGNGQSVRVVSVAGEDVWAGGDNGRVYRSADSGQTWTTVVLPEKNGANQKIAHIRLESPREIRIEAVDGTTWVSADGGATWN
jgi:hypothetical protein